MINHLRTILLNKSGTNVPIDTYVGEEYISAEYAERPIVGSLRTVHNTLFLTSNSRSLMNFRLHQYLKLLHAGPLAKYVYDLDPRVTYLPWKHDFFTNFLPVITVKQLAGTPGSIYLASEKKTIENNGRIEFEWNISVLDLTQIRVRQFDEQKQMVTETIMPYELEYDISNAINLPGSSLSIRFNKNVGASWLIKAVGKPEKTLYDIYIMLDEILSEDAYVDLFGERGNTIEPYRTCAAIWSKSNQVLDKLSAAVLALGYRINEQGS